MSTQRRNTASEKTWFRFSAGDGALEIAPAPDDHENLVPTEFERRLYGILAVAPELVDAAGELPVTLFGGQSVADLELVDALGRLTLVECKRERATSDDLAQLLGYAYMEAARSSRLGSFQPAFAGGANETYGCLLLGAAGEQSVAEPAMELMEKDCVSQPDRIAKLDGLLGKKGSVAELGSSVGERLFGDAWTAVSSSDDLSTAAERLWGRGHLTLARTPTRLVLVAPTFEDDVVALAAAMAGRGIWIDLAELDIARERSTRRGVTDVRVGRRWRQRSAAYPVLWSAVRRIVPGLPSALQPSRLAWEKGGPLWVTSFKGDATVEIAVHAKESELLVRAWADDKDGRDAIKAAKSKLDPSSETTWAFDSNAPGKCAEAFLAVCRATVAHMTK